MGDRYFIEKIKCAYCGYDNEDIGYAPSSKIDSFVCEKCGKKNLLVFDIVARKVEDMEGSD